jgi:hypothetical protein
MDEQLSTMYIIKTSPTLDSTENSMISFTDLAYTVSDA